MADSKKIRGITWIAARPAVLPLLTDACTDVHGGTCVTFCGTEPDLIGAGVATADMFEDIGKSGQRTRNTDFGDKYTIERRGKKWQLMIRTYRDIEGAPTDERPRPSAWWRKHGGEAQTATSTILARLRTTRRTTHG